MRLKRTPNPKSHGQRGISILEPETGHPRLIIWENGVVTSETSGVITREQLVFATELATFKRDFDEMYKSIGPAGAKVTLPV